MSHGYHRIHDRVQKRAKKLKKKQPPWKQFRQRLDEMNKDLPIPFNPKSET